VNAIVFATAAGSSSSTEVAHSNIRVRALDEEADDDEELYLVGTASERDALILNTLADAVDHPDPATPAPRHVPGVRIRRVSPNVSFVFYKSAPYGLLSPRQASRSALYDIIGEDLVRQVLER
jgi:hypothetical protein